MRSQLLAAFALVLAPTAVALAQGPTASAVAISARHQLLGDPLFGGAVGVSFPRRDGRVAFRVGADHLRGQADRIGVPCAGMIQPGTCSPEPLRDEARLTSASGGASLRMLRGQHALLAFTSDLTLASLRADTRGLTSGRALTATKLLWGGMVGADLAWTPVLRLPLALEVGGGVGVLMPVAHDQVVDGYQPFDRAFGVRRLRVGVAWRP